MIDYEEKMRQLEAKWTPDEKAQYEAAGAEAELGLRMAEMVWQARTDAGLTQAQLASRMGVSQSHISALEGGGTVPTLATLARIAAAVGRRVDVELVPVPFQRTHQLVDSYAPSERLREDIAEACADEANGDYDDIAAADIRGWLAARPKATA